MSKNIIKIFLLLIYLFTTVITAPIAIPLKIITSNTGKYPVFRELELSIEQNDANNKKRKNLRKLQTTVHAKIDILSCNLFAAEVSIGSNNQNFTIILDTGSIVFWVPKVNSDDGEANIAHHYDPATSQTATGSKEKFQITYGTGSTEGYYYHDYVRFIASTSYDMHFGVASKLDFNVQGADGIMGLARKYSDVSQSAIITMKNKKIIPSSGFSFKYDPHYSRQVEMFIGDEHEDFSHKNTATCQLLSKTNLDNIFWTCKLYNFGLIDMDRTKNATAQAGFNILFDTGSNICILPTSILTSISNELSQFNCNKATSVKDGMEYIVCKDRNNVPDIFIEVGDNYIFLDSNDFFYESQFDGESTKSYVLNVYFQETTMPIIGQPFFTSFHTKFDPEQKVLKFHSQNENAIVFSSKKPDNDPADSLGPLDTDYIDWLEKNLPIIASVVITIAVLLILCKCIKICKSCGNRSHSGKKSSDIEYTN